MDSWQEFVNIIIPPLFFALAEKDHVMKTQITKVPTLQPRSEQPHEQTRSSYHRPSPTWRRYMLPISLLLTVSAIVLTVTRAQNPPSPTPKDVAEVMEKLQSEKWADRCKVKKLVQENGLTSYSFTKGIHRYNFFIIHSKAPLLVRIRPQSLGNFREYETVADRDLDASVDSGNLSRYGHFSREYGVRAATGEVFGARFRSEWQRKYNLAINDALECLKEK